MMKKVLPAFALLLLLPAFVYATETKVFSPTFGEWVGKLQNEWTWLHEVPENWRITKEGLEIRMVPTHGPDRFVQNILFRPAPRIAEGDFAITLEVKSLQPYCTQFQQAGIYWMRGDRYRVKFVLEIIDGQVLVWPGGMPLETEHVVLRLRIEGNQAIAEFQPNATGEFREAFRRALPEPRNDETDRIGLQSWHGPADKETWVRFMRFEITMTE